MTTIPGAGPGRGSTLPGVACTLGGLLVFSVHDACVKLLVADLPAPEILLVRSATLMVFCAILGGRGTPLRALRSPVRDALLLRGGILVAAWLSYYSAARHLQLGELVTIYFASPLLVAVLAVPLLGERIGAGRWAAILVGFAGVVLACRPGHVEQPLPVMLALLAATLWAVGMVLLRRLAGREPVHVQLLLNNLVFFAVSAATMPWLWRTPTGPQVLLLALTAGAGSAGLFLIYEGIARAPASVVAPLEFTALIWSFALGYLIWGTFPPTPVFAGAALILASGAAIVGAEWRAARPPALSRSRRGTP